MKSFDLVQPTTLKDALSARRATWLAGGSDLLPLMKTGLADPARLVDVRGVPGLRSVRERGTMLEVGAAVTLAELLEDPRVQRRYPALAEAIAQTATPQIRNRATIGGNARQAPRCLHYRSGLACAASGGEGCPARDGDSEQLAVLGAPEAGCATVHPSDPAVALAAYDARLVLAAKGGARRLPITRLSEARGLITAIELPSPPPGARGAYVKAKDRSAFAFALASAAAVLVVKRGRVAYVRLALGGVAPRPWRAERAEAALLGQPATPETFAAAAELELASARPLAGSGYKVLLARNIMIRALETAKA